MDPKEIAKWVDEVGAELAELKRQLKLAQEANAPLLELVKTAEAARKKAEKDLAEALALVEEFKGRPEVKKRRLAEIGKRESDIDVEKARLAAERKKIEEGG